MKLGSLGSEIRNPLRCFLLWGSWVLRSTHRPLRPSSLWSICRIRKGKPKKELLRGLWVVPFSNPLLESSKGLGKAGRKNFALAAKLCSTSGHSPPSSFRTSKSLNPKSKNREPENLNSTTLNPKPSALNFSAAASETSLGSPGLATSRDWSLRVLGLGFLV